MSAMRTFRSLTVRPSVADVTAGPAKVATNSLLRNVARETLRRQIAKKDSIMPKLIVTHEVDDVAHWLASPKREELLAGVATNITTFVLPGDANQVAVSMDVADMDALDALMKSDAGAEAMKSDGVRPDTVVIYVNG